MAKVQFARRASEDLEEIAAYLLERSPQAARRFRNVILDLTDALRKHPLLGSENPTEARVRSVVVPGFPYRMHYTFSGDDLWIVHIRHAARRPWREERGP